LTDRDRAVPAGRTSDGYREVTAGFVAVLRQQERQEIGQAVRQLGVVGLGVEESHDLVVLAGLLPQAGNEMRIGQETDVEQQVGAVRNASLEAEADQVYRHP